MHISISHLDNDPNKPQELQNISTNDTKIYHS